MSGVRIGVTRTRREIERCHPVMQELRPRCDNVETFVDQVARQQKEGYLLAFVEDGGEVRAVAGYRFLESLFSGKFLYVDDLVTREQDRSRGYGGQLLDWLVEEARAHSCENLELDSGVQRFDAHRFYFLKRMHISSYHFKINCQTAATNETKAKGNLKGV